MDPKLQINGRVPSFAHQEWVELRRELRKIGTKPTDGDLLAALIHAAVQNVEKAREQVEEWVVHELAVEDAEEAVRLSEVEPGGGPNA